MPLPPPMLIPSFRRPKNIRRVTTFRTIMVQRWYHHNPLDWPPLNPSPWITTLITIINNPPLQPLTITVTIIIQHCTLPLFKINRLLDQFLPEPFPPPPIMHPRPVTIIPIITISIPLPPHHRVFMDPNPITIPVREPSAMAVDLTLQVISWDHHQSQHHHSQHRPSVTQPSLDLTMLGQGSHHLPHHCHYLCTDHPHQGVSPWVVTLLSHHHLQIVQDRILIPKPILPSFIPGWKRFTLIKVSSSLLLSLSSFSVSHPLTFPTPFFFCLFNCHYPHLFTSTTSGRQRKKRERERESSETLLTVL